jgi:hypothetical protein
VLLILLVLTNLASAQHCRKVDTTNQADSVPCLIP